MDPADGEPSLSTSELYLWSSPCQPHLQSSQLLPERLLLPESKKKKFLYCGVACDSSDFH